MSLQPVVLFPSTRVVYYLHTVPATWREANSMCQSYGAVLLILPDFTATSNSLHYVDLHSWGSQLNSLSVSLSLSLCLCLSVCLSLPLS